MGMGGLVPGPLLGGRAQMTEAAQVFAKAVDEPFCYHGEMLRLGTYPGRASM
jgi:hypothetical protein